jgi:hypothetical protein
MKDLAQLPDVERYDPEVGAGIIRAFVLQHYRVVAEFAPAPSPDLRPIKEAGENRDQIAACAGIVYRISLISIADMREGSAIREVRAVKARHLAMWLARHYARQSYPNIGRYFGGRDHSTVMDAVKKVTAIAQRLDLEGEPSPERAAILLWRAPWIARQARGWRKAR